MEKEAWLSLAEVGQTMLSLPRDTVLSEKRPFNDGQNSLLDPLIGSPRLHINDRGWPLHGISFSQFMQH